MSTTTTRIFGPRRTAWMAARARNAARRGGLVAAIGLLAVMVTVLVLVLVPREVNRSVRARLAELPPPADTVPLLANLTGAMDRLRNAEANLQSLRVAYADRVAHATANTNAPTEPSPPPVTAAGQIAEQSDARRELLLRVARARSAPLVENFRAVGDADFLRNDAPVRLLLDSLNEVNRDRDAYAALGGPDARYAAMTARLATLGQRLLLLAEQRLAAAQDQGAGRTAATVSSTSLPDSLRPVTDTALLAQAAPFSADSTIDLAAREALDSAKAKLQASELLLQSARALNDSVSRERKRVQAGAPAQVPPIAMLIAALVVGVAVGYGVAFYREVKHPRVADAAEAERVTDSRVIVHSRPTRADITMRHRRQSDEAVAPVIDTASESYPLLHVTLTGFGDTSRRVEVVSQDLALGATVAINLAAAAVHDSRSTLLVDPTGAHSAVQRLLAGAKPKRRGDHAARNGTAPKGPPPNGTARQGAGPHGAARQGAAPQGAAPQGAAPQNARVGDGASGLRANVQQHRVGRNLFIDTVSLPAPGRLPDDLLLLANEHDFSVVVRTDATGSDGADPASTPDVILCARAGATSLQWLSSEVEKLRLRNQRLRAVLLWSAPAPGRV